MTELNKAEIGLKGIVKNIATTTNPCKMGQVILRPL